MLKIQRMHSYDYRDKGSNLTKLFHVTCREAGMVSWVQLFGRQPPEVWEGRNCPNVGAILDNFTLRSRISSERMEISKNRKKTTNTLLFLINNVRIVLRHVKSDFEILC